MNAPTTQSEVAPYLAQDARWSNAAIVVQYKGVEIALRKLCTDMRIAYSTVWGRLKKGWAVEDAIDTPARRPAGSKIYHANGYAKVSAARVSEHIQIAELALRKSLPKAAEVHHVNCIKTDNRNCNLVICNDHAYHSLLHMRTRALDACGNPNFRKCAICGEWDDPKNMYQRKTKQGQWHRACGNITRAERKRNAK